MMKRENILIIGAGGIGGFLADNLARALSFSGLGCERTIDDVCLTLMDGDLVEMRNLPHQRFGVNDVGKPKVVAMVDQLHALGVTEERGVKLRPIAEDFSADTDLSQYDLVVVAVDREEPRNLVHANAEHWLDLRARGDGFVMCSHEDGAETLEGLPKLPAGQSTSCQLEDAIERGNIQFGFALAASHGAQWIVQWLRNSGLPQNRMYSIHMGDLPFPQAPEVDGE